MGAREPGAAGTSRALVLNATFEPLGVVSTRRALLLVLGTKAEFVHATTADLSFRAAWPFPNPRWSGWPATSGSPTTGPWPSTGGRSSPATATTASTAALAAESIDHVMPRSRGGQHVWDNVVAACRRCNTRKEDRLPHEVGLVLRTHRRRPVNGSGCSPCPAGPVTSGPRIWASSPSRRDRSPVGRLAGGAVTPDRRPSLLGPWPPDGEPE